MAGPDQRTPSYISISSETMVGGITAEEYAAQQVALHARLMKEMPVGLLNAPILIRLTEEERRDLRRRQETNGGPTVVGRTKPISTVVHFSPLDSALLSANPRRVGPGLLQATADGGFVWAAAIRSQEAGALRVHLGGL